MLFIGIDPGASGGIAVLDERGAIVCVGKMPESDRDLLDYLETAGGQRGDRGPARAIIERVWSSPQMGVASAFKFGMNVGAWKMALAAARIPYEEIIPSKWQTIMGCRVGTSRAAGGPVGGDKNITKRRAQALFPDVRVTHAIADALLIAEFCRRINSGAQLTTRAPQKGLFDHGEEDRRLEELEEQIAEGREGEGAAEAATEGAAGHGGSRHRGDRARRARLRRRAG